MVPPAKSTPSSGPLVNNRARMARLTTVDRIMATRRYLVKGMLVPGLINSISRPSNADAGQLPRRHPIIVIDAGQIDGGHDRGENSDAQGHGESLDRAGAELEQDHSGEKRGDVRIEDGGEGPLIARLDRGPGRFAVSDLLANPLVDRDLRIHRLPPPP